jgi:predicted RNA-binding Zn-ribbon protein involved in translation (DUF1610 family)
MKWKWPFLFLIISSFMVFIFSLWDIIFKKQLLLIVVFLYLTLFAIVFILMILHSRISSDNEDNFEVFEKSLKGGLYHFKCPRCSGFFAVKESRYINKKSVVLTCPDCGSLGRIPSISPIIIQDIPRKKSGNVIFECLMCGENLKIWAEGTSIYPKLKIYSCPYCGNKKPLQRI